MRPFFMSIVSDSNHWMFISSNGGLTAGRRNSRFSLFPYYTDDKITEMAETTGPKTIFRVETEGGVRVWEPFSIRFADQFSMTRNLYKNAYGNKILFEEINHDLGLVFRYQWNSSNLYGFVRKAELTNLGNETRTISLVDGIQNILPYGIDPDLQTVTSNLADAYKRSEIIEETGLGIISLSALIVDKAEPSEALKANVIWSDGLINPGYLLSSLQLQKFRSGEPLSPETDIKGEKGAYFLYTTLTCEPKVSTSWRIIANVNLNHAQVVALNTFIATESDKTAVVDNDIKQGSDKLIGLVASADGLRYSSDELKDARQFANVMFNIMRGGVFDFNYRIEKQDLEKYLNHANKTVFVRNQRLLSSFPDIFSLFDLEIQLKSCDDHDLHRLLAEYLPLKFSRRHGDPSRPWNQFSINTQNEIDGSKVLDYQGNWRDIFQNWEALVHSYPEFIEGMIFRFLNASTFDGYNPYRITKDGFDWEAIEPDNPWSYIGYWGDHQVIYLLKFLEFYRSYKPESFMKLLSASSFVYANVPYKIKPYADICRDPKNTIEFDKQLDYLVRQRVSELGSDGALLQWNSGEPVRATFMEKILVLALAKLSNFIPEAGIWMNTQRPEWNDANNALVGNGVSMVTLYYLRRFFTFFEEVIGESGVQTFTISKEVSEFFNSVYIAFKNASIQPGQRLDDTLRKRITDQLGEAGSTYRTKIYSSGFEGSCVVINSGTLREFISATLAQLDHTIKVNRRQDGLYQSYNIISLNDEGIRVEHLNEMLEGQVAVLSSGALSVHESLDLLNLLRSSVLYRPDQNSYILYPNRQLPGFMEKNRIPTSVVQSSILLSRLVEQGDFSVIQKDVIGDFHFNGNFRNVNDVHVVLDTLEATDLRDLVCAERELVGEVFEQVFNHKAFTGRSGTFYAYEGLGSIYWHMVSKLHLAVMEVCQRARREGVDESTQSDLFNHFVEIGEGIGVHKSPELYGAFPTDPYSHTPYHRGAQQPGMTGQVKEDILVNWGELGVRKESGKLGFMPELLQLNLLSTAVRKVTFKDVFGTPVTVELPPDSLAFTCCQVPVIYAKGSIDQIQLKMHDGSIKMISGLWLDTETSEKIFKRTGEIVEIRVHLESHQFKA
jgi:hypothetical protein